MVLNFGEFLFKSSMSHTNNLPQCGINIAIIIQNRWIWYPGKTYNF